MIDPVVDEVSGKATIEALTTGAQTFELVFAGVNEVNSGQTVTVTVHRAKIGAARVRTVHGVGYALETT